MHIGFDPGTLFIDIYATGSFVHPWNDTQKYAIILTAKLCLIKIRLEAI